MPTVEPVHLLNAVREISAKNRGKTSGWAIAWTDAVRGWFATHGLDAGERAQHRGEELSWNGSPFQLADDENVHSGMLRKWRRLRVPRPGKPHPGGKWEVGWSMPDFEKDAFKLSEGQELETWDARKRGWVKPT